MGLKAHAGEFGQAENVLYAIKELKVREFSMGFMRAMIWIYLDWPGKKMWFLIYVRSVTIN